MESLSYIGREPRPSSSCYVQSTLTYFIQIQLNTSLHTAYVYSTYSIYNIYSIHSIYNKYSIDSIYSSTHTLVIAVTLLICLSQM